MTLDEKIKNRETELQIAYDNAIAKRLKLKNEIFFKQKELDDINQDIEYIKQRAKEQKASHIL